MKFKNYYLVLLSLQWLHLLEHSHIKLLNKRIFPMLHIIIMVKQCTWWAFKRRAQLGKPVSNRWGNAKNWYSNARRSGYATGHKPRKYAVMQSTRGYYGHVAVVEKVYKNGKIKISEYNYNVPLGYGTRIISKSSARNYNYIY